MFQFDNKLIKINNGLPLDLGFTHTTRIDAASGIGNNIATGGVPGDAKSGNTVVGYVTGAADTVATTLGTFTIPNIGTSIAAFLDLLIYFDTTSAIYDSCRCFRVSVSITRKVGVVGVGALIAVEHSATNAVTNVNQLFPGVIATSAAGATFTSVVALGAETGGATASNTWALTVASTASAGSPTTAIMGQCTILNASSGGGTFAFVNA